MAGNQGNNKIIWHQWQIDFVKENFATMTAQQLADRIGIKRTSVRYKYYELGLKKYELEFWTKEQISFLKSNYKQLGDTELAEIFASKWSKNKSWSKKHIEKKRRQLGLKRTQAEIDTIKNRNVKAGRYADCPVKAWATRGTAAANGEIRFWKRKAVIKVNGKWVHWARYTMLQAIGKRRMKKVVVFKNGNQADLRLENLKIISRKQLASMNKEKFHLLPTDLQKNIKTINKFKKQIKVYAKQNERLR